MIQLLERVEQLHSIGYVHNDIKLENIVIGAEKPSKIYLIDFGLSAKYIDEKGQHVQKQYISNFSGNFFFASLNSVRGFNKSRRDDIESLFYLLIYMLNQDNLPWCDLLKHDDGVKPDLKTLLKKRLDLKYTKQLFASAPPELTDCLKKVMTLTFEETPSYQYYKETLASCALKLINPSVNSRFNVLEQVRRMPFEWIDRSSFKNIPLPPQQLNPRKQP